MTTAEQIVITVDQGLWCLDEKDLLEIPAEVRRQHAAIKARYCELLNAGVPGWQASLQSKAEAVERLLANHIAPNPVPAERLPLFDW